MAPGESGEVGGELVVLGDFPPNLLLRALTEGDLDSSTIPASGDFNRGGL